MDKVNREPSQSLSYVAFKEPLEITWLKRAGIQVERDPPMENWEQESRELRGPGRTGARWPGQVSDSCVQGWPCVSEAGLCWLHGHLGSRRQSRRCFPNLNIIFRILCFQPWLCFEGRQREAQTWKSPGPKWTSTERACGRMRENVETHKRRSEAWGQAGLGMFGCARREQEIGATVERRQREV